MKLKELPGSLWMAWKLKRLPRDQLINEQHATIPVIISLTSIPSRLDTLHLVIRSLLTQTSRAEKNSAVVAHGFEINNSRKPAQARRQYF